jgi:hypothetical protein
MNGKTLATLDEKYTRAIWFVAAIVAMFLLQCWVRRPYFGIDDSNIFQVYGWNLAHGYGWVYHAGYEHVEGTTSFLYTLLWALTFLTPWPQLLMHLINLACALAAFWTALRALQCVTGHERFVRQADLHQIVYLLWIGLNPGALTWMTVALMDTSLWTFLVVAAVYVTCRLAREQDGADYARSMSLIGGVMALTRPESLLLVPAMILLAARISYAFGNTARQALRMVTMPLTVFGSLSLSLMLFRYFYFGFPFPNTYYAKVSADRFYDLYMGLRYLIGFLHECPLLLPLLAIAGFVVLHAAYEGRRENKNSPNHLALCAVVLPVFVLLFIPILNGGDHFAQGRFFVPVVLLVPLPCLGFFSAAMDRLSGHLTAWAVTFGRVGIIILVVGIQGSALRNDDSLQDEFGLAVDRLQTGEILSRIFQGEPKPTVGVIAAGGIARTYDGYVIDLLGLNNTLVAHSERRRYGPKNHASFSTQAFYRLSPDLFEAWALTPPLLDPGEPSPSFDELTHYIRIEPAFQQSYEIVELWFRDPAIGRPSQRLLGTGTALDLLMRPRLRQPVALRLFMKRDIVSRLDPRRVEVRR